MTGGSTLSRLLLAAAVALLALPASAQVPPLGPDFPVCDPDYHVGPWVAVNPYGTFLAGLAENFGGGHVFAYDREGGALGYTNLGVLVLDDRPMHLAPGSGDTSGTSIQARWFAADGTPLSDRWQVNATTAGDQSYPDLATAGDRIAIVWQSQSSSGSDQSGTSIQLRVVSAYRWWADYEVQVNTHTPLDQTSPDVALAANGDLVVTWQSQSSPGGDTDGSSVQVRHYPGFGPPGDDLQVNTYTAGDQVYPAVGIMDGGAFEVLWRSEGSPANPNQWSVERRPFEPDGSPAGDEVPINTSPVWGALPPDASMTRHGDLVAAWDADAFHVRARIFRSTLLVDGFETGTTAEWSFAEP